jgi:broad specificity phosphatase PhoE
MIRLARHGQTAYNAAGRFQGHLPVPLDETGRAQAHALAQACVGQGFTTLVCSPLRRARETADIVAGRIGLEPVQDERWVETDAGDWTDRTFAEIVAEDPEAFAAFARVDPAFAFPGGESFAAHQARVAEAAADLRACVDGAPTLVVCHGVTMRLALVAVRGDEGARTMELPNAALVDL